MEDAGTVKIGIGDFVFFSVLAARAANYGFVVVMAASLGVLVVSQSMCQCQCATSVLELEQ